MYKVLVIILSNIPSEIAEGLGLLSTNYYVGIVRDALNPDVWRRVGDGVAVDIAPDNWFSESSYNQMSGTHVTWFYEPLLVKYHNKIVNYPASNKYYFICEYF